LKNIAGTYRAYSFSNINICLHVASVAMKQKKRKCTV